MRYNEQSSVIEIATTEFVSIARRGVSPAVAYDEDEPTVGGISLNRLASIIGGTVTVERLTHNFTDEEYSFTLYGDVITDGNRVTVACATEGNPKRPRKSEIAELRGEGYITAYMLAKYKGSDSVGIRFIYLNEGSGEYAESFEQVRFKKLSSFFEKCLCSLETVLADSRGDRSAAGDMDIVYALTGLDGHSVYSYRLFAPERRFFKLQATQSENLQPEEIGIPCAGARAPNIIKLLTFQRLAL